MITPEQMAAELNRAATRIDRDAAAVIKRGALEIKNQARASVAASHSNPGKRHAAANINFDMLTRHEAEIGYDKPAGALGTMNEYGSAGNTPGLDLARALEAEGAAVERYLGDAVDRAW